MPFAVEEFLRVYAPVTMARIVAKDVEVGGGARCRRATGCCCRSRPPTATPRSSRTPTSSSSTGARTATPRSASASTAASGSNLARMELRVAIEEWLRRVPDFELSDPDGVRWSTGQVRGPRIAARRGARR